MGFDFGLARIGVAVGSLDSGHAEALTVLGAKNGQPDWNKVAKLVAAWQPATLVVGQPFGDSVSQPSDPAARQLSKGLMKFRETLQTRFNLPVEFADEAYTSTEARHLLSEQRRAGRAKKVRKGEIDMTAATVILQSWLSQTQPKKTAGQTRP